MEYVITGREGQLGHAFSLLFPDADGYIYADLDIADSESVGKKLKLNSGDVLLNAAAYVQTELAENDLESAYRSNAFGPLVLARHTSKHDAILLHVSTDYVFDGEKGMYDEEDRVAPINVYGLSKYAGEQAVRAYNPRHYIIRTSALFGPKEDSFGTNFVSKRVAQLKEGKELSIVSDQYTIPTYTIDLAKAIQSLVEKEAPFGTYHIVNSGDATSWYDFMRAIADSCGFTGKIKPKTSDGTPTSGVRRPRHSTLKSNKLQALNIVLPPWSLALKRYITEYGYMGIDV